VSLKKCCCGAEPPGGAHPCADCPDPIPPATVTRYRIDVSSKGIHGEAAGTGTLALGGLIYGCMQGVCSNVIYARKALVYDISGFPDCPETTICAAIPNTPAPSNSGFSTMEWTECRYVEGDAGYPVAPDINYSYDDHVRIDWCAPYVKWTTGTCGWNVAIEENDDCITLIQVTYTYRDEWDYPYFEAIPGDSCYQNTATTSVAQSWVCTYSSRGTATQVIAEGTYQLVRCEYPEAFPTNGATGICYSAGGIVCSTDGITSVAPPTVWQPPPTIFLTRVS